MWQRLIEGIDRRQLMFWAVYLGVGALLFLIFSVWIPRARYNSAVQVSKCNAHAVQLAFERFSVDSQSGFYPSSYAEVVEQGYISKPIINPFTRQPIKVVTDPEAASPGDVVYLPKHIDHPDSTRIAGYELIVNF